MDNIQHLVVDASPFINQSIDLNMPSIVTTSGTIKELRDRKAQQLVLQYPIKTKEASREALLFVIEFSKKTGDYQSLSKNDLDVLALTLELEWNTVGRDHLRNIPKVI